MHGTAVEKKTPLSNFMEIRQVGFELFNADGQTDMTKLIITFGNFAKTPKLFKTYIRN